MQSVQIFLLYFQCFSSPVNFAFGTPILPVFSFLHLILFLVQKNLICWPGLWFLLPYIHTSQPCFSITLIEDVDLIFRKTKWTSSMFHLQHASITLQITFTPSFSHQVYWIWLPYFGCTSQPAFIAFRSLPCTHFNAFFCLQDTILSLIDLSIAVFDAFFAFTALSVIHSNSRIDLEESLVRFVFGVCIAKPTRGSSISFPCSVNCLFQVGFNTNFQGFSPCFISKLKYVPGG